jgi:hypothetical protein
MSKSQRSNVLIIGITQNGKSTLIKRLLHEYGASGEVEVGDGFAACTSSVEKYEVGLLNLIDTPGLGEINEEGKILKNDKMRCLSLFKLITEEGISTIIMVVNKQRYNSNRDKRILNDYLSFAPQGIKKIMVISGPQSMKTIPKASLPAYDIRFEIDSNAWIFPKLKLWKLYNSSSSEIKRYSGDEIIKVPTCLNSDRDQIIQLLEWRKELLDKDRELFQKELDSLKITREDHDVINELNQLEFKKKSLLNEEKICVHREEVKLENNWALFFNVIKDGLIICKEKFDSYELSALCNYHKFEHNNLGGEVRWRWYCKFSTNCHFLAKFYLSSAEKNKIEISKLEEGIIIQNGKLEENKFIKERMAQINKLIQGWSIVKTKHDQITRWIKQEEWSKSLLEVLIKSMDNDYLVNFDKLVTFLDSR